MRPRAVLVLVLAGAAGLAALGWWLLRPPAADETEVPKPPPGTEGGEAVVGPLDVVAARRADHTPWPFGDFTEDIAELKRPAEVDGVPFMERGIIENSLKVYHRPVEIDLRDVHPDEVVAWLAEQFKDTGVRIWSGEPKLGEWDRVTVTGKLTIPQMIDQLREQTQGDLKYVMTWQGLCIGSRHAIEQAALDAQDGAAAIVEAAHRDSEILTREYRPGLEGATIGAVGRDITAQTGVEVVIDGQLWSRRTGLTWRGRPQPLRDAIGHVCRKFRCTYRVKDGRVFLLEP